MHRKTIKCECGRKIRLQVDGSVDLLEIKEPEREEILSEIRKV